MLKEVEQVGSVVGLPVPKPKWVQNLNSLSCLEIWFSLQVSLWQRGTAQTGLNNKWGQIARPMN
jgi:hypothetical protein